MLVVYLTLAEALKPMTSYISSTIYGSIRIVNEQKKNYTKVFHHRYTAVPPPEAIKLLLVLLLEYILEVGQIFGAKVGANVVTGECGVCEMFRVYVSRRAYNLAVLQAV